MRGECRVSFFIPFFWFIYLIVPFGLVLSFLGGEGSCFGFFVILLRE